jgi:hypothetical protein
MFTEFRLDPEMFKVQLPEMPQTQKKKRGINTYNKEAVENRRRACKSYRKDISSGFKRLKKWVPGKKDLIRPELLIETVNYIQKLQNEIKEVKKESKKRVKELEHKEKYIEELEKKIKEQETPWIYPSEPHLDPETTMDVRTTSPTVEEELPEEELLPEEEFLPAEEELIADFNLELLASPLPELKSIEEIRRWLEL